MMACSKRSLGALSLSFQLVAQSLGAARPCLLSERSDSRRAYLSTDPFLCSAIVAPLRQAFRIGGDPWAAQLALATAGAGGFSNPRPYPVALALDQGGRGGGGETTPSQDLPQEPPLRERLAATFSEYMRLTAERQTPSLELPADTRSYFQLGYGGLDPFEGPALVFHNPGSGSVFYEVKERGGLSMRVQGPRSPLLVSPDQFSCIPGLVKGRDSEGHERLFYFHFQSFIFAGSLVDILFDFLPEDVKKWQDMELIVIPSHEQAAAFNEKALAEEWRAKRIAVLERPNKSVVSVLVTPEGVGLYLHRELLHPEFLSKPVDMLREPNFQVFAWDDLPTGRYSLNFTERKINLDKTVIVFPPAGEDITPLAAFFQHYPEAQEIRTLYNGVVKRILGLGSFDLLEEVTDNPMVASVQRHVLHLAHHVALWKIFEKRYGHPVGFIGISRGAGAAYVAAGAMTPEQAAEWATYNARFNYEASALLRDRRMAVVRGVASAAALKILAEHNGYICIRFTDTLFTISAPESEFPILKEKLKSAAEKVAFSVIPLKHASHDRYLLQAATLWQDYRRYLEGLRDRIQDPTEELFSQLGGHRLETAAAIIDEQRRQTVETLLWDASMQWIATRGPEQFLQLGSAKASALEQQAKIGLLVDKTINAAVEPGGLDALFLYEDRVAVTRRKAVLRRDNHRERLLRALVQPLKEVIRMTTVVVKGDKAEPYVWTTLSGAVSVLSQLSTEDLLKFDLTVGSLRGLCQWVLHASESREARAVALEALARIDMPLAQLEAEKRVLASVFYINENPDREVALRILAKKPTNTGLLAIERLMNRHDYKARRQAAEAAALVPRGAPDVVLLKALQKVRQEYLDFTTAAAAPGSPDQKIEKIYRLKHIEVWLLRALSKGPRAAEFGDQLEEAFHATLRPFLAGNRRIHLTELQSQVILDAARGLVQLNRYPQIAGELVDLAKALEAPTVSRPNVAMDPYNETYAVNWKDYSNLLRIGQLMARAQDDRAREFVGRLWEEATQSEEFKRTQLWKTMLPLTPDLGSMALSMLLHKFDALDFEQIPSADTWSLVQALGAIRPSEVEGFLLEQLNRPVLTSEFIQKPVAHLRAAELMVALIKDSDIRETSRPERGEWPWMKARVYDPLERWMRPMTGARWADRLAHRWTPVLIETLIFVLGFDALLSVAFGGPYDLSFAHASRLTMGLGLWVVGHFLVPGPAGSKGLHWTTENWRVPALIASLTAASMFILAGSQPSLNAWSTFGLVAMISGGWHGLIQWQKPPQAPTALFHSAA